MERLEGVLGRGSPHLDYMPESGRCDTLKRILKSTDAAKALLSNEVRKVISMRNALSGPGQLSSSGSASTRSVVAANQTDSSYPLNERGNTTFWSPWVVPAGPRVGPPSQLLPPGDTIDLLLVSGYRFIWQNFLRMADLKVGEEVLVGKTVRRVEVANKTKKTKKKGSNYELGSSYSGAVEQKVLSEEQLFAKTIFGMISDLVFSPWIGGAHTPCSPPTQSSHTPSTTSTLRLTLRLTSTHPTPYVSLFQYIKSCSSDTLFVLQSEQRGSSSEEEDNNKNNTAGAVSTTTTPHTPAHAAASLLNSTHPVLITDSHGTTYRAKRAIIAVPLGVLKQRHVATKIDFLPGLPKWKREAIENVGFGAHNKVVLRWRPEDVFWPG